MHSLPGQARPVWSMLSRTPGDNGSQPYFLLARSRCLRLVVSCQFSGVCVCVCVCVCACVCKSTCEHVLCFTLSLYHCVYFRRTIENIKPCTKYTYLGRHGKTLRFDVHMIHACNWVGPGQRAGFLNPAPSLIQQKTP